MWTDILKGKVTRVNLPKKVKRMIKKMGYHYIGYNSQRKHTRHYFKVSKTSPYVLWVDTSGSASRGENILAKIRADIRRTASGRGRGSGSMKGNDDVSTSMDIYEFADSIVKSENFQQYLKENMENIIQHFREIMLEEVNPKIRANWGIEQWSLLDKEAEQVAQEFMQKEIFDKVKSKYVPFKKEDIEKRVGSIPRDIRELIFKTMSDGAWRTIPEITEEIKLREVWGGYNVSALSSYFKTATGKHSTRGGNLIFDRKKVDGIYIQPNGTRNKRRIFSYRLLTEKLHKAKLITSAKTKISQRKEPVEEPDEECIVRLKRIRRNIRGDYIAVPAIENEDYKISRVGKVQGFGINVIDLVPEEVACAALDFFDKLNFSDSWLQYKSFAHHAAEAGHKTHKDKNGKTWAFYCYKHVYCLPNEANPVPFQVYVESMVQIQRLRILSEKELNEIKKRPNLPIRLKAHSTINLEYRMDDYEEALDNPDSGEYAVEEGRADPIEVIKAELKEIKEAFA
jgi:hypothetical protein